MCCRLRMHDVFELYHCSGARSNAVRYGIAQQDDTGGRASSLVMQCPESSDAIKLKQKCSIM